MCGGGGLAARQPQHMLCAVLGEQTGHSASLPCARSWRHCSLSRAHGLRCRERMLSSLQDCIFPGSFSKMCGVRLESGLQPKP